MGATQPESDAVSSLAKVSARVMRYVALGVVAWSLLLGGSLAWNVAKQREITLELATNIAQANFNKDVAYRLWASGHGGVYVEPTEKTPPSPWMAHLPDRDLIADDGRRLTLMNPAYMLREMMQDHGELYGIKGRIVGIVTLNPNNQADPWEAEAIRQFTAGRKDQVMEVADIDGAPFLRLFKPFRMEASCQKCHGHLGFQDGEVRGGIGVSVPLAPYLASEAGAVRTMAGTHGALWLMGALAIAGIARRSHSRLVANTRMTLATRDSERRFREMAETIDQVFFVAERDYSRFHYISPAFRRLWGRDPEALMADPRGWPAWIHPEDRDEVLNFVASRIGSGEYESDFRVIRPDGSVAWLHAKAFEVTHPAGGAPYTLGFHSDVTQAKTIEEALRDKNQALERSNADLEAYAYVASHDLREPLRNITSFSTLLTRRLEGRLSDEEAEFVKIITDAANRMDCLVRDLLEVSRVGCSERAMQPVSLSNLALAARDSLRSQMEAANAEIRVVTPLPMVMGSDEELYRVLLNLFGNALKYHGTQPVRMTVDCRADGPELWRITVADNGIGLEPGRGYEERIFGLFQRLHQREEYGGGTGIGLPICRKIIERHGGRIWAESDGPGQGTRIVFTLPKLAD